MKSIEFSVDPFIGLVVFHNVVVEAWDLRVKGVMGCQVWHFARHAVNLMGIVRKLAFKKWLHSKVFCTFVDCLQQVETMGG